MRRNALLFLLFLPFFAEAQTTTLTVSTGVPLPVQVNASYRGASGFSSIYYYVCSVFPSGYVCQTQPAVAGATPGISGLGGGNTVTVSWTLFTGRYRLSGYAIRNAGVSESL